jgi:hypothetical protein
MKQARATPSILRTDVRSSQHRSIFPTEWEKYLVFVVPFPTF